MPHILDTATLKVINNSGKKLSLWTQKTECNKCLPMLLNFTESGQSVDLTVNTNFGLEFSVKDQNNETICNDKRTYSDTGVYSIDIMHENSEIICKYKTLNNGRSNAWPLVGAFFIYIFIAVTYYFGQRLYRDFIKKKRANASVANIVNQNESENKTKKKRVKSLDCFRGITMLMMIFANYGSGKYEFLDHIQWDGLHFADVIFPWFVFIMGSTMAISFNSIVIRQRVTPWKIYFNIIKRSFYLFLIGIILYSVDSKDYKLSNLRIMGVLQRFALSYLIVASAHAGTLLFNREQIVDQKLNHFKDIIVFWPEWILMFLIGLLYFGLTFLWEYDPTGYCPIGYVGPGGLHDEATHINCTGGAANKIDVLVLGTKHMYGDFTAKEIYDPKEEFNLQHDPEGILGTTNSIILTFFGLQIGKILVIFQNPNDRIIRWFSWGVFLGVITTILAVPEWVPINKNLWSFSYITCTGSAACFALTFLYYLIDVLNIWPNGFPFHYPGMNSILLYIGHGLTQFMFPWYFYVEETDHIGPLARNLIGTTLWLIISIVLAHKKVFLTL